MNKGDIVKTTDLKGFHWFSVGIDVDAEKVKMYKIKGFYYAFNVYQHNKFIGSYGYRSDNLKNAKKQLKKDLEKYF